jgi:hypothetical protein
LLLSLPVLAGIINVPVLNTANCWELLNIIKLTQSAGNLIIYILLGIFRDYTPNFTYYLNDETSIIAMFAPLLYFKLKMRGLINKRPNNIYFYS